MKRVVIANFYPVWPPRGGGQRRIFFLARELAKEFEVEIVAPERSGGYRVLEIASNLLEFSVPVEKSFRDEEIELDSRVKMAADLAYAIHWEKCALYQQVLAMRLSKAHAAVSTHPYSAYAVKAALEGAGLPIVFDSQNVELRQKRNVLGAGSDDLKRIADIEREALSQSAMTIACSPDDAAGFAAEYGVDAGRIRVIENGVDALGAPVPAASARAAVRASLGIKDQLVAIFAGSFHFPNFRAVEHALACAKALPDVVFLFLGTVCRHESLQGRLPDNVRVIGMVGEDAKWLAFAVADVGLNPMEDGSGTNIKVFEYAAGKLAVLSTPFGVRGIGLAPEREIIVRNVSDFPETLAKLARGKRAAIGAIGAAAREAVVARDDWTVIGRRYIDCFKEICRT